MNHNLNLPDGFVSVLDARARLGKALYGQDWPEIERASEDQRTLGNLVMFAAEVHAAEEITQSLGEDLVEAARKSWKFRARTVTDLLDWLRSGALRGYLFRPGRMPELQPIEAWQDQALVDSLSSGSIEHGDAALQKSAYAIVREDDLRPLLEGTKKAEQISKGAVKQLKRGPRPKFKWDKVECEVVRIATEEGLPATLAELEDRLAQWCEDKWQRQPAISTLRTKLSPLYRRLREQVTRET